MEVTEAGATGNRVFFGNLSWDTTEETLREFASQAGPVTELNIPVRFDGKSKGFGLVTYETPDAARKAIETFSGQELDGRELNVREDLPPESRAPRRGFREGGGRPFQSNAFGSRRPPQRSDEPSLFVRNLAWATSWQNLKDAFAAYNPTHTVILTRPDGYSRGMGIVRFSKKEDMERAMTEMNGVEVDGRAIEVREDRPPGAR